MIMTTNPSCPEGYKTLKCGCQVPIIPHTKWVSRIINPECKKHCNPTMIEADRLNQIRCKELGII